MLAGTSVQRPVPCGFSTASVALRRSCRFGSATPSGRGNRPVSHSSCTRRTSSRIRTNRFPNGVKLYSTSTGGFSPKTLRPRMPNRVSLRSRWCITFGDKPGHARNNALGRVGPRASTSRSRIDHLQPWWRVSWAATERPAFVSAADPRTNEAGRETIR